MDSTTPSPGQRPITALLLALTALAALPRPAAFADDSLATAAPAPAGVERPAPALRFDDVVLSTGVRLRYAEQGDPAGAPVLLLHGYTDSWFSFSRVLPAMPEGWRVLALDQRGHGASEQPERGYALAELAADVIAFMDAVELPRATLIGHSMGSLVAQQVALAAPERVERLVLIGSATTARNPVVIELAHALAGLADPLPAEFVRDFQNGTVHVMPPPEFMNEVVATSRKMPIRVWRALIDGMLATEPARRIAGRPIPTLILWGEHDAIFPRSEQEALLELLPGAELVEYPETGHAPHWERPERVARDLERFLGDAGGAARTGR